MNDTPKLNEYHDVALTIQFSLKVSMNVCQRIWNIVVQLFSIGKEITKEHIIVNSCIQTGII